MTSNPFPLQGPMPDGRTMEEAANEEYILDTAQEDVYGEYESEDTFDPGSVDVEKANEEYQIESTEPMDDMEYLKEFNEEERKVNMAEFGYDVDLFGQYSEADPEEEGFRTMASLGEEEAIPTPMPPQYIRSFKVNGREANFPTNKYKAHPEILGTVTRKVGGVEKTLPRVADSGTIAVLKRYKHSFGKDINNGRGSITDENLKKVTDKYVNFKSDFHKKQFFKLSTQTKALAFGVIDFNNTFMKKNAPDKNYPIPIGRTIAGKESHSTSGTHGTSRGGAADINFGKIMGTEQFTLMTDLKVKKTVKPENTYGSIVSENMYFFKTVDEKKDYLGKLRKHAKIKFPTRAVVLPGQQSIVDEVSYKVADVAVIADKRMAQLTKQRNNIIAKNVGLAAGKKKTVPTLPTIAQKKAFIKYIKDTAKTAGADKVSFPFKLPHYHFQTPRKEATGSDYTAEDDAAKVLKKGLNKIGEINKTPGEKALDYSEKYIQYRRMTSLEQEDILLDDEEEGVIELPDTSPTKLPREDIDMGEIDIMGTFKKGKKK